MVTEADAHELLAASAPTAAELPEPPADSAVPSSVSPTADVSLEPELWPKRRLLRRRPFAVAAVIVSVVTGLVLWAISTSPRGGTLTVSVVEPGGAVVSTAWVEVDSVIRCQSLPCRIDGVEPGPHVVHAQATGHGQAPSQTVKVEPGAEARLSFTLARGPRVAAKSPAPVASPKESEADPTSAPAPQSQTTKAESAQAGLAATEPNKAAQPSQADLSRAKKQSPGKKRSPPKDRPESIAKADQGKEEAPKLTGKGSLTISSNPSGMVFVDGRRLGMAPRQVTLRAGPHTVMVQHPDFETQSVSVTVEPKKSTSVMLDL